MELLMELMELEELCREQKGNKVTSAIKYKQKHLATWWQKQHLREGHPILSCANSKCYNAVTA